MLCSNEKVLLYTASQNETRTYIATRSLVPTICGIVESLGTRLSYLYTYMLMLHFTLVTKSRTRTAVVSSNMNIPVTP